MTKLTLNLTLSSWEAGGGGGGERKIARRALGESAQETKKIDASDNLDHQ